MSELEWLILGISTGLIILGLAKYVFSWLRYWLCH